MSIETGLYTYALGAEVKSGLNVPELMDDFEIPESEYILFTSRKGPVQEIVVETWQYIWGWSKTNKRAFLSDFELYDHRAKDPENSQVEIYISVI